MRATQTVCTSKNLQAKQLRLALHMEIQSYSVLYGSICTGLCAWHDSYAGKADFWHKQRMVTLLKKVEKLWAVVKYSWLSNKQLSSWDIILGKNRTEHNKAATLTWLVVSPQLPRQQVFVRMLSRPKGFTTNLEQDFAGLHEEVQICYKIKFIGLNWNCNERSWRDKLNWKY